MGLLDRIATRASKIDRNRRRRDVMIYELEPDEFRKISKLFEPINYNLAVESIIEGFSKAKIFVDDKASPKSAITWFKDRAGIAGDADNDSFNKALRLLFAKTYYKELTAQGAKGFRLHYTSDWQSKINLVLGDLPRIEGIRHYYHLDVTKKMWEPTVLDGFELHPVNAELLASTRLRNLDDVIEEMQSERLSVEDFLQKSFGYCVINVKEIVGWCMSEYDLGHRCELGITNVEGYRRRGIATTAGTAVIKHALVQGITDIGWHCWADNKPSIATARRLGFTKRCAYPVYEVPLKRPEIIIT